MGRKEAKTNAMRILEREDIPYESLAYEAGEFTDGTEAARKLGLPPELVFKTLVTEGADREHYVFVIPVQKELDLKKCARAAGVKSVAMIHVKDLLPLTGYVRGGCTAVGMKKPFPVLLDNSAREREKIYVSAGRIGCQLALSPEDYRKAAGASYADLTAETGE